MTPQDVESNVRRALGEILGVSPDAISPEAHLMDELGADSLQFLNFVHALEREFGTPFDGSAGDHLSSVALAVDHVLSRLGIDRAPDPVPEPGGATGSAGPAAPVMDGSGVLSADVEVGMPLTGRNNLAESPLLKLIGDLRWRHIGVYSGVDSKDLTDDTGERLYATFYYVETHFPEGTPMAAYGENDRFTIASTLHTYGRSIMDGYHFLLPEGSGEAAVPEDAGAAVAAGVPYLRTSNIFVKMLQGASWLKKSKPAQPGISNIPELDDVPETTGWVRDADENNTFGAAPGRFLRLTPEGLSLGYDIVPDRDLNGVGLLYFANYPLILDIVEREALAGHALVPFSEDLIDLRTVVRRRSAYLSNASQSDSLQVSIDVWIEDLEDEGEPVRLVMNHVMSRVSDGRKMMVSTVSKTLTGVTAGSSGLLPALRAVHAGEAVGPLASV